MQTTAKARASAQRCTSITGAANERAVQDRRKAFLSQSDPDRIRIDRPAGTSKPLEAPGATTANGEIPKEVTASVSVSELLSAMNPGAKKDPGILDFWFEGKYMNYDTGSFQARESDGNFSVMYFGSKYMVGPDIMIGALAQFDQTGEALGTGNKASASGWMAGPYVSVRFGPGIMFDGRAAWGTTQNLPLGIAVDSTSAERSLLRGTVRGTRQYGGWDVTPKVGLSYVEDTPSGSPVSSSEGSQKAAGTGRLDIVPEVKRRFDINSETYIEPRVAAGGFLSFDEMSALNPGRRSCPKCSGRQRPASLSARRMASTGRLAEASRRALRLLKTPGPAACSSTCRLGNSPKRQGRNECGGTPQGAAANVSGRLRKARASYRFAASDSPRALVGCVVPVAVERA